ncbi:MAG: type II toxin-antitoxin system HigB family toxin [Gloeobacterales cyanobacterium]
MIKTKVALTLDTSLLRRVDKLVAKQQFRNSPGHRARIEARTEELIEEEMTLRIAWSALTAFSHFERIKNIRIDSGMHLIAIRELRQAAAQFSDVASQIEDWYQVVKGATWQNLEEVRQTYRSAEAVRNFTVFNIKGNRYRLIVSINYIKQTIYFKYFLTHAQYDKEDWKNDPYF